MSGYFFPEDRIRHKWFGVGTIIVRDHSKKTIDVNFGNQIVKGIADRDSNLELLSKSPARIESERTNDLFLESQRLAKLLAENPTNTHAICDMADFEWRNGKFDFAVSGYHDALVIADEKKVAALPNVCMRLAIAWESLWDRNLALIYCNQELKYYPASPELALFTDYVLYHDAIEEVGFDRITIPHRDKPFITWEPGTQSEEDYLAGRPLHIREVRRPAPLLDKKFAHVLKFEGMLNKQDWLIPAVCELQSEKRRLE